MCETILSNVPGNQEALNQLYTSFKQTPAPRNYLKQSLCWTCARARALPDPEGCAFHRREHEHVYDQAEYAYNKDGDRVVSVTECQRYERTAPTVYDTKATHKAKLEAAENIVKAAKMRREGQAFEQIAEALGCHVKTAAKYCAMTKTVAPTMLDIYGPIVLELRAQGMSCRKIAKKLNIAKCTAERYARIGQQEERRAAE
jgi:DNA-binding CsgD family transcriptional regulator